MQVLKKSYIIIFFIIMCCLIGCENDEKNNTTNLNCENEGVQVDNQFKYSSVLSSSFYYDKDSIYGLDSNIVLEDEEIIEFTADNTNNYYSLLKFIDKSTNTKVVLCNKPNCSHNDNSCNAFFSSWMTIKQNNGNVRFPVMNSAGYVFLYNENLYVLDPFGDLFVMNKDGSNHTKLLSIDSKYSINNGFLYGDCIYLCVQYLPSYDGNIEQEFSDEDYNIALLKLNLKNSKYVEVFSFKTELETTCLGIYENKVYFFYRSPNKLVSANNQQAVDNEENNHDVSLYYYDLSKSEREYVINNIKSHEMDDIAFDKDAVYYHNRKEEKIVKLNLRTGEKHNVLINIGGYIEIYTPINDNKLYFMKDNQLANAFSNEIQINEKYCVDLNTGDVNKVNDIN